MFLDPDDEFALDMCETMYNKITNSDAQIVKCNMNYLSKDHERLGYEYDKHQQEVEIDCDKEVPPSSVSVCNAIHDRNFLLKKNIMFPPFQNGEDMVFFVTEFLNAKKIIHLNSYHGYKYYVNEEVSHSLTPSKKNLNGVLYGYLETKKIIEKFNRTEIYCKFFSETCFSFFLRIVDYKGKDKKEYLKIFYDFEKSINCNLTFNHLWMNIVNKFIMKKQFTIAMIILNTFSCIKKTPLLKMYRKTL